MTPIAIHARTLRAVVLLVAAVLGLALSGCTVGPKYVRPSAPLAPAFNEPLPENFKSEDGWKPAQPSDAQLKGDWWTLFDDPQLDALEAADRPSEPDVARGGGELSSCARRDPIQPCVGGAYDRDGAQHRRCPRF